jgi:hypothetical protein
MGELKIIRRAHDYQPQKGYFNKNSPNYPAGSVKKNVAPLPNSLVTQTLPP